MYNIYDDGRFFYQYAQMSRSREGLSAAGEWRQMRRLFPDLQGKSALDLGCGYGWHCRFSAGQGAARVLGIDISKKMIEETVPSGEMLRIPGMRNELRRPMMLLVRAKACKRP